METNWIVRLRNAGISSWIIQMIYELYGGRVNTEKFQNMINVLCKDDQRYGIWKFLFKRDHISSDHDILTNLWYLDFPIMNLLEIQAHFGKDYGSDSIKAGALGITKLATAPLVILGATVGGSAIAVFTYLFGE